MIAEGVDLEAQREILTEWGCDALQGFLVSAARPIEDFLRFVTEWEKGLEKVER